MTGVREDNSPEYAAAYVRGLQDAGIRGMVSFQAPEPTLDRALKEAGIVRMHEVYPSDYDTYWNFHWWLGFDKDWTAPILEFTGRWRPDQVAIQCRHGVDRTGNAVAFLMAVRHGVPITDAWYAVVEKKRSSVEGLADVFEEFGVDDRRGTSDPSVGSMGYGRNGMSVDTDGYKNYVRETVQRAQELGASW